MAINCFFRKIFSYTTKLPNSWLGIWEDESGRKLSISATKHSFYLVTIQDSTGHYYPINLLKGTGKTKDLIARTTENDKNCPILQVEIGSDGLGPTYDLTITTKVPPQNIALFWHKPETLIIQPTIGMGLYDDWEDNYGVPWTTPFSNYQFKGNL